MAYSRIIRNVPPDEVAFRVGLIVSLGGTARFEHENGAVTIYAEFPGDDPELEDGTTQGSSGSGKTINITETSLDAIARVSQSEVGHFAKHGEDQLIGGLKAVADTILNRVAHDKYPQTVEGVVNQSKQFSAINPLGTWTKLPEAKSANAKIIEAHIEARSSGEPSSIGGATHFLNPHLSSATAMNTWGKHVVENAIAVFGDDAKQDVHYHGFAPGTKLPGDYSISFRDHVSSFTGEGILDLGLRTSASEFASRVIRICSEEWEYFERGSKKEADDPQYKRVGDYWELLGIPINGRTLHTNSDGQKYNPPWSSAFISYVAKTAGAGDGFKYAQAHCHYVQDFISGRSNAVYQAVDPKIYAPKPGDILHYGRQYAKGFDYTEARSTYLADSFYPSHSDYVISVNPESNYLYAIGGNVRNSVSRKKIQIDADGLLKDRSEGGNKYPWIAVLKCI